MLPMPLATSRLLFTLAARPPGLRGGHKATGRRRGDWAGSTELSPQQPELWNVRPVQSSLRLGTILAANKHSHSG